MVSIGPTGIVDLKFSKQRLQEIDGVNVLDEENKQDIETVVIFDQDEEGDIVRIHGQFEGNVTRGISMYIEPNESTEAEKLQFDVQVLNFTSENLMM